MIRVVLAVVLATALVGIGVSAGERAERDRNAELATGELETLAERAARLAAENDPVAPGAGPATTTLTVRPPAPTLTDGGQLYIDDDRLLWRPATGRNRTVEADVPVRVEAPISVAEPTRLRLRLVRGRPAPVVRIDRPNVEGRSRGQRRRARATQTDGLGV